MLDKIPPFRHVNSMCMSRKAGVKSSFLIVEGVTDPRFYEKFIDNNNCQIIVAGKKDNVEEIIQTFYQRGFNGAIGIVDADFMHLEAEAYDNTNILLTDSHDLETLLINSKALENILYEYADWETYNSVFTSRSFIPLREALLNSAKFIGYILWASLKHKANLKFSEIDYNNLVSKPLLEIQFDDAFNHIVSISPNHKIKDIDDFKDKILELINGDHDLWQVCRGHDLTEILCIGLKEVFGSYNSRSLIRGSLEGALRIAYERKYFYTTRLYGKIIDWEKDNQSYVVLKDRDSEVVIA